MKILIKKSHVKQKITYLFYKLLLVFIGLLFMLYFYFTHANVYFLLSSLIDNKTVYFIVSLKLNQGFRFVLFYFCLSHHVLNYQQEFYCLHSIWPLIWNYE